MRHNYLARQKAPPPPDGPRVRVSDRKIRELARSARDNRYRSHTERYDHEVEYARASLAYGTPKWFQYASGNWARSYGQDDAWDVPASDDYSGQLDPNLRRCIRAYQDSHEWWGMTHKPNFDR